MRGVALEIPRQLAFALGNGQFVRWFGKMVHADVHITRIGEPFDGMLKNSELLLRQGQGGFVNLALGFEQMGQMRIVKHRNSIRAGLNDPGERRIEARHGLERQAVNQVKANRFERGIPSRFDDAQGLRFGLNTVDRPLYCRVKILHPQAEPVETQRA